MGGTIPWLGRIAPRSAARNGGALERAGLTFATVDDKMYVIPLHAPNRKPGKETHTEHVINIVFSTGLLATVIGLWIYFR